MNGENSPGLLATSLAVSVPLLIMQLRDAGEDARTVLAAKIRDDRLLQKSGDNMLYAGTGAAKSHAAYATAVALLAFAPGGVRFGELCFCAAHPAEKWGDFEVCAKCLAEEAAAVAAPG